MTDTRTLTVEEHRVRVLSGVRALPPTRRPVSACLGLVLAEDIRARHDVPSFDNSAMDGFAVRSDDTDHATEQHPVELVVVADLRAGGPACAPLTAGTAAQIMTGAAVRQSADAVVPVEAIRGASGGAGMGAAPSLIRVAHPVARGAHVRRRGELTRTGSTVLSTGTRLGPRHLAAAAATGASDLLVAPPPRVAILSTGDELVPVGEQITSGRITDSNSLMLTGLVEAIGAEVTSTEVIPDDERLLAAALDRCGADRADVIVLSGGASAGASDVVRSVLLATTHCTPSSVAVQPGRPQLFTRLPSGTLVFGLPGNPVSAAVSFELFVRPTLLALQGAQDDARHAVRGVALEGWRSPGGREQYLPVSFVPCVGASADLMPPRVIPVSQGRRGSHDVVGLAAADGLAVVPAATVCVRPGDAVDVLAFP